MQWRQHCGKNKDVNVLGLSCGEDEGYDNRV